VSGPVVEILYFEECPNYVAARELVERVAAELGLEPELRMVDVETPEDAERLRFLGSPTVRVGGRDVEPGADERVAFVRACRVYRTPAGLRGTPDEAWVRETLLARASA
jgi:hypothetical protein